MPYRSRGDGMTLEPRNLGISPTRPDRPGRPPWMLGASTSHRAWSPAQRPAQGASDLVLLANGRHWHQGIKAPGGSGLAISLDPNIARRLETEAHSRCWPRLHHGRGPLLIPWKLGLLRDGRLGGLGESRSGAPTVDPPDHRERARPGESQQEGRGADAGITRIAAAR